MRQTSKRSDAAVKLVDFGLTTEVRSVSEAKPGTWAYWPPETFGGGPIGKSTDMWSLGVVLFVMLSGYHPFDPTGETDDETLQQRILLEQPDFDDPVWDEISAEAKGLIRALLRRDPAHRLTIEQLLQQPWLTHSASSDPLLRTERGLRRFRQSTAALRAASFAAIVQQQQVQQQAQQHAVASDGGRHKDRRLARGDSMAITNKAAMLEADMLANAFRVFDPDGKGYITESAPLVLSVVASICTPAALTEPPRPCCTQPTLVACSQASASLVPRLKSYTPLCTRQPRLIARAAACCTATLWA